MGILSWIVLGLIAGILAKLIMPGRDPGGFILTILIGVAGAMLGGFIATGLGWGDVTGVNLHGIMVALGGSVLVLLIYRALRR